MKFKTRSGSQYILDEETMILTRLSEIPVEGDISSVLPKGVRVHGVPSVVVGERASFDTDSGPLLTTRVVEVMS